MLLAQIVKDHPREPPHVLAVLRMRPSVDMLPTIVRPWPPALGQRNWASQRRGILVPGLLP